ncbi:FAD-dependent oxidoreductase [Klebsiella quasipneumoniae subsp. similipneumoniae]|uniref:flavin monoamine oxidase family protein n=1 Tax=Klebsiella quasipneumoniae TaxID=1463165 RepID=UPI0023809308|nr:FAD-dependent oxidoreductase [Klebsiella quasipneumoniae]MDE4778019.1 FAD-dependent oxidoreductase [Klebsiella quasipneumoniae subsp. similipneumoniae]
MMNTEVIIVGGGLSGLYAARLLEKAGIDYLLLEGRERMGGRILQANTAEADLGATWFWPTIQPALKQLLRELNIVSFSHQERGDMLFERPKDVPSRHPGFVSLPAAARVSGGMSRLADVLLAELKPGRIQAGLQVKHIEQQNGTLNVCGTYADGRPFSRQTQHVLLALPPMLAAGINYFPALPTTLLQAWRNTGTWMAPHAKYVAVYTSNRKGLSGEVRSNIGPMVEIHDVSEPDRMFALFGFIGVPFHERQKIGDAVLRDLCKNQLIRLFGEEAAYPHAEFIKDWAADPFTSTSRDLVLPAGHSVPPASASHGSWCNCLTGIASEWSTVFPGYLAGAIDAAAAGVQHIIENKR